MEKPPALHLNHRETNTNGSGSERGPKINSSADAKVALETASDSLGVADLPQTKDSPLTDIGTSPPPFNLQALDDRRTQVKDSYESSELSDLGAEESEAETDKMDFLDDDSNSTLGEKVSDLQALSQLTELARLQEVDSDDSDDDSYVKQLRSSVSPSLPHSEHGSLEPTALAGSKRVHDDTEPEQLLKRPTPSLNGELDADALELKTRTPPTSISPKQDVHHDSDQDAANESTTEKSGESESNSNDGPDDKSDRVGDNGHESDKAERAEKDDAADKDAESKSEGDNADDADDGDDGDDADDADDADEDDEDGEDEDDEEDEEREQEEIEKKAKEKEAEEGDCDAVEADVEDTVKQEELEEQREQSEAEAAEETRLNGELVESGDEEGDSGDLDLDLDEHRKLAVSELILIETDFAHLRDKLFHDKLSFLENELQLCLDGSHPELLEICYKVNQYYQDSMKLANSTLNYSLKCINNETIATRTAIHQDFLRKLMDTKKDMVTATTSLWYKINRERNMLDQIEPEYYFSALPSDNVLAGPPIAPGGSTMGYYQENTINKKEQKFNTLVGLVEQRNNFNHQLGILNGLKEFHGIPSAISTGLVEAGDFSTQELLLRKATQEEIMDDLQAMGIF